MKARDRKRAKRLLVSVLLGASACGGERATGGMAGPPIAEASPPYTEWTLDSRPGVRIGAVDGPAEYQWSRVAYAARLEDGRFVVVDGGSDELRWFSPDGHFEARAGGRGQGPGELSWVVDATLTPQDTVVLYDGRNQRLTWFGPEGSLSHTIPIGLLGAVTLVPLRDARLVIAEERPTYNFGREEYNSTRDSVLIMVTGGGAGALDTLMRSPGREAATWVGHTDGRVTAHRQMAMPFGETTLVGSVADRIVMVEDGRRDLVFLSREGEVMRLARRTDVNPPLLSAALRREYVTNVGEKAKAEGRPEGPAEASAEHLLELIPEDHRLPAFDRMLTDPVSGRIWVRDYLLPWDAGEAEHWTVYDSTGHVLARVTTPRGLDVMQVGPSHVVGVERDEMGVEYVTAYAFR